MNQLLLEHFYYSTHFSSVVEFEGSQSNLNGEGWQRSHIAKSVALNYPRQLYHYICLSLMSKGHRPRITESLLAKLIEYGLLLQQDKTLPNVVSFVTGEVIRGSWWSHPDAQTIYSCLNAVIEHRDVLVSKLVLGKVTLIHRRLWPSILAVANAHDPWQFEKLSEQALNLYKLVEQHGTLLSTGQGAKELEQRLLVHTEQVHTELGRHATQIESWMLWAERAKCQNVLSISEGKFELETAIRSLGGKEAMLPWHRFSSKA